MQKRKTQKIQKEQKTNDTKYVLVHQLLVLCTCFIFLSRTKLNEAEGQGLWNLLKFFFYLENLDLEFFELETPDFPRKLVWTIRTK